jgi:glycosyltransferase involved in cell wall biosynthesis
VRYAVIVPVYNERDLLPRMLERLLATPPVCAAAGPLDRSVIVVDDGSTDGSRSIVEDLEDREGFSIVLHDHNRGKGASVRSGLERALALAAEIALIHDADLEYDPRDHQHLLDPILDGRADAVFGSRFLGETHRVLYYWHSVANRLVTTLSNMLTNLNLTDIECCLKALTREVIAQVRIEEDRFGVEPELVAKVARLRLHTEGRPRHARVFEVAVRYAGRTYDEGRKIGWKDGVSALRCILKYRFR